MRTTTSLRAVAVLAAALFFSGCAASLAANKRSPGVVENGQFKPSRPPQANYGADPLLTCPDRGNNGALIEALKVKMGEKAPQQDGRLCAIADTLLGWPGSDKGEIPPDTVRAFLSQYFGLPSTFRTLQLAVLDTKEASDIATALVDSIGSFASTAQNPKWGLMSELLTATGGGGRQAIAQGGGAGKTKISLILYDDNVSLEPPLPKKLAANASAPLNGKLLGNLKAPKLAVVDPVGKLDKGTPSTGQEFHAALKCGDKPGKILVQISAEGEGGDVQAASMAVGCATELASSVKMPGGEGSVEQAAAEKLISDSLNKDRTAVGLKPLNANEALTKISRGIAEAQARGRGVSSGELMAQLKEADIATPLILESATIAVSHSM